MSGCEPGFPPTEGQLCKFTGSFSVALLLLRQQQQPWVEEIVAGQAVRQLSHHAPGAWRPLSRPTAQSAGPGADWLTRQPAEMLGQALPLTLLLLLEGRQGQGKASQCGLGWGLT